MSAGSVASVGILAPGLENWQQARLTLAHPDSYRFGAVTLPRSGLLPANERRRASALTRICLVVAQEATEAVTYAATPLSAQMTPVVFASCHGDAAVTDRICRALASISRPISPTDFHNSVHNAPAGYWTIASQTHAPATSVSMLDGTFAAGLLEALTIATIETVPVLLIACDMPLPPPLDAMETVRSPFAVAIVVAPERHDTGLPAIRAALCPECLEDRFEEAELEALRAGNPAARSLPLLRALCVGDNSRRRAVCLPYLPDARLRVEIDP